MFVQIGNEFITWPNVAITKALTLNHSINKTYSLGMKYSGKLQKRSKKKKVSIIKSCFSIPLYAYAER